MIVARVGETARCAQFMVSWIAQLATPSATAASNQTQENAGTGSPTTGMVGTVLFAVLVGVRLPVIRIAEAAVVLAATPLLAAVTPLVALVIIVALVGGIAIIESVLARRREARRAG